jgi:hypothetical protein
MTQHGGARPKAGRKQSIPTTCIRVPTESAESLKKMAAYHRQELLDFCNSNQVWKWGDTVTIPLRINGELRMVQGMVRPGFTQVSACEYPLKGHPKEFVITIPYDPPGTLSVQYRWADVVGVVQLNLDKLRRTHNAEDQDT